MEEFKPSTVVDPETGMYMRTVGTDREATCKAIATLYGNKAEVTYLTCSGMNAIYIFTVSLMQKVRSNEHPVALFSDELYCDTRTRIVGLLERSGITVHFFDQQDSTSVKTLVTEHGDNICCLYLESVSNPSGKPTDWSILGHMPEHTVVCVDNTFLSPVTFNPFCHKRVDVVVESCTKYLSGSTLIAGHITCRRKSDALTQFVDENIKLQGIQVSPRDCRTLLSQLTTLHDRVRAANAYTRELLGYLSEWEHTGVTLFNSSTYKTELRKYMSPMILFNVKCGNSQFGGKKWKDNFEKLVTASGIAYETSYGKAYNAICNFPHRKEGAISFRLALGYSYSCTPKSLFEKLVPMLVTILQHNFDVVDETLLVKHRHATRCGFEAHLICHWGDGSFSRLKCLEGRKPEQVHSYMSIKVLEDIQPLLFVSAGRQLMLYHPERNAMVKLHIMLDRKQYKKVDEVFSIDCEDKQIQAFLHEDKLLESVSIDAETLIYGKDGHVFPSLVPNSGTASFVLKFVPEPVCVSVMLHEV